MAAKVGIRQNSRIVMIAGCKVFQDQRRSSSRKTKTGIVHANPVGNCATIDPYTSQPNISEGTRSPLNRKASEREWRRQKWVERMARRNLRLDAQQNVNRVLMEAAQ